MGSPVRMMLTLLVRVTVVVIVRVLMVVILVRLGGRDGTVRRR